MATLPRRLLLQSRQCPSWIRPRSQQQPTTQWHRPISSTTQRPAKEDTKEGASIAAAATPPAAQDEAVKSKKSQTPEQIAAAQLSSLVADLRSLDPAIISDALRKGERGIPFGQDFNLEKDEDFYVEEDDKRKIAAGFWAEGEESMGPDEDYYGDDITSHGHGELQQHRDMRHYARLIAWEMPLLNQLAKPYELPTSATPFRFRYTSYFNTPHPATNKVVVEFCPTDLSLTPIQVNKLIKLSGPRYHPGTKLIKMSCEKFDTQTQNKRSLGESIHALIAEAKDSKDTFEDVPFDFRHYKPKPKFKFPEEWVMTGQRRKELDAKRAQQAKLEDEKVNTGRMIDGSLVVDTSLPFVNEAVAEPVMVGGQRGKELRR